MPVMKKDVPVELQNEIRVLAQERTLDGGYAYTYSEIAAAVSNTHCELTKDDVSALCLANGIRRKVRGSVGENNEDAILAKIQRLHDQLSMVRQRVKVTWALTGKKFFVDNCDGKSDAVIIAGVRDFLANQKANRMAEITKAR